MKHMNGYEFLALLVVFLYRLACLLATLFVLMQPDVNHWWAVAFLVFGLMSSFHYDDKEEPDDDDK